MVKNAMVSQERGLRAQSGRCLHVWTTAALAFFLSAVLAFGGVPVVAWADEGSSVIPAAPEEGSAPSSSDNLTPGSPDASDAQDTPETPEGPENPDISGTPEAPETPESPESPEVPELPETPEVAALTLSGVDFLQPSGTTWEVLRVDNLEDQTLYLDIARISPDGTEASLIKRGAYTTKADQSEGFGEEVAQIITLDLAGTTTADVMSDVNSHYTYRVSVYTERRGETLLYEGTVYPVYAELRADDAVVSYELLGIRTASIEELTTPKSLGAGDVFYKEVAEAEGLPTPDAYMRVAADDETGVDNRFDELLAAFVVPFEKQTAQALTGSIRYIDEAGNLVKETFVRDFTDGVARVRVEDSFLKADENDPAKTRYYRTLSSLAGTTVTLTAANAHAVVRVVEVQSMTESDYAVTVRYIDENDALLWSDTIDVKGYGYQYTLPTTFSMLETDGVELYTLRAVEGNQGEDGGEEEETPEAPEVPEAPETPDNGSEGDEGGEGEDAGGSGSEGSGSEGSSSGDDNGDNSNPDGESSSGSEVGDGSDPEGEVGSDISDTFAASARQAVGAKATTRSWNIPTVKFDATIDPDRDFLVDANGRYYVNARYTSSAYDGQATLTLVAIDGSTGERLPVAYQPMPLVITPDQGASFTPQTLDVDGTPYVPWSGNTEPITYIWADLAQGIDLLQYVYYVPQGYTPEATYDVTVQYVNIANNAVLRTDTYAISPELSGYMTLMGEERFTTGGNEYVRLAGQEQGIRHGYYSPARLYTVYYRDVNDVINADTVIRRTQIVETERVVTVPGETITTTTTIPGTFTTITAAPVTLPTTVTTTPPITTGPVATDAPASAGTGVGVGGGTDDAGADGTGGTGDTGTTGVTDTTETPTPTVTETGVTQGDGTTIINDDENPLANQAGQSTTTERTIEDNETPLANLAEMGTDANSGAPFDHGSRDTVMLIVSGIGAVLAGGAAWALIRRKRKQAQAACSTRMDQ